MRRGTVLLPAMGVALLLAANSAFAYPSLQLTIDGGTYNTSTETTVTSAQQFTLYALAQTSSFGGTWNTSKTQFYLSIALEPMTNVAGNYGSFTINGQTINVTSDMVYGVPPIDANLSSLPKHGEYPTYFAEIPFKMNKNNTSGGYDVADNPGVPPTDVSGNSFLYNAFNIDTTNLAPGANLHFDLYTAAFKNCTDTSQIQFAPFSHDAEYDNSGPTPPPNNNPVPEPVTASLAGLGLLCLGLSVTRRRRHA